jgi:hypothetical protein
MVVTCYLAVSAGRAVLIEQLSRLSLVSALAQNPRFHYMAQAILALVLASVLVVLRRIVANPRTTAIVLTTWLVWAAVSPIVLARPVTARPGERERTFAAHTRARLEQQIRAIPAGATACLSTERINPVFPVNNTVVIYVLSYPSNDFEGRHVRFVTSDPTTLALRERGERLRSLLAAPDECPGS